jgi:hypothetical protein
VRLEPSSSAKQEMQNLYLRFRANQDNAKRRGIDFELSFGEWLNIWLNSGVFHLRGGRKPDQYVLARYGDQGPYAMGNVRVITKRENDLEKWGRLFRSGKAPRGVGWKHPPLARTRMAKARLLYVETGLTKRERAATDR